MSKFAQFMKANKKVQENAFYAATKSLCDENGQPLEWEFRHITSAESESIRDSCMDDFNLGKGNYLPRFKSSEYISKLIAASVGVPDLRDAELQDSYDVKKPEDLLLAMVDDPGEYNRLGNFVQQFLGLNVSFEDKVGEAKN